MNLGHTIVTNGDFTVYVCDSAAMRPSSEMGRLVILVYFQKFLHFVVFYSLCVLCN